MVSETDEFMGGLSVADVLALCVFGPVLFGPVVLAVVTGKWSEVVGWSVDHGVLVAESTNPVIVVPYADGAGLDSARLLFTVAAVIALIVVALYGRYRLRLWRLDRRIRKGRV